MSGVVVARFVLGRVAHRIRTCGHNMWLLTCLSMCCRFGRVGHFFFVLRWLGFVLLGNVVLFCVGLHCFVSLFAGLFVFCLLASLFA